MPYASKSYLSRPRTLGKYRGRYATNTAASVITRAVRASLFRKRFNKVMRKPKFGLNINNIHRSFRVPARKFKSGSYNRTFRRYNRSAKERLD